MNQINQNIFFYSQFDDGKYRDASRVQTFDNLRRSIPGEPDVDYPVYADPPVTEFSCVGRADGNKIAMIFFILFSLFKQIQL